MEGSNIVRFPTATTAPLINVSLAMSSLTRAINRKPHLPGMVVFSGPSGWGKSTAVAYAANKHRAYYVSCKSTWNRIAVLKSIAKEMGLKPSGTLYDLTEQIASELVESGRALIIDEMDFLVEKKAVEIVRDLYEASGAAIMLVGEEQLPHKLKRWERFHGRVLEWTLAQPVSIEDTELLHRLYCKKVEIADDLLQEIHRLAHGSARRVAVNLDNIQDEAIKRTIKKMNLTTWKDIGLPLYTGEPPRRS